MYPHREWIEQRCPLKGLGLASVMRLLAEGARVVIADLRSSHARRRDRQGLGENVLFAPADVSEADMNATLDLAQTFGPLRVVIDCAGRGGPIRLTWPKAPRRTAPRRAPASGRTRAIFSASQYRSSIVPVSFYGTPRGACGPHAPDGAVLR